MDLSRPLPLSHPEKLLALQRLDHFREWHSLDEKRYCLVCGQIITGWEIEVAAGPGGNGMLQLSCPTERCNSIPMDWVLLTDEILAVTKTMSCEQGATLSSKSA